MDKHTLRHTIATTRSRLNPTEVEKYSQDICRQIISISLSLNAKTILCYCAKGKEADINEAMQYFLQQQKTILLPSIEGNSLVARKIQTLQDLEIGPYGILQPLPTCPIWEPAQIDLAFIPGIAFDQHGNRLGRGAGFYDRFLPLVRGTKIGIGYELQLQENIPLDPHDIPVDAFITEKKVYHFK